jgi:RimJ/RimL family protein N-acetyltransferase
MVHLPSGAPEALRGLLATPDLSVHASLRDGSSILIRRLRPDDAPLVESGFLRLSEESRRLRFLTPKPSLSPAELRYLVEVDGHRHEALCAIDPASNEGIGIARFVRDEEDRTRAEVAVTVVDAWQRRGVGTLLLEALTDRARAEGITCFTAIVSADNRNMRGLLARLDAPVQRVKLVGQVAQYEIEVEPKGLGSRLHEALRAAAEGHWPLPPRLWEALRALVPIRFPGLPGR